MPASLDHLWKPATKLTGAERELAFCVASATEWECADITETTITGMVDTGLIERDAGGQLKLTRWGNRCLGESILDKDFSNYVDIGGGLQAWTVDWTDAHWNVSVLENTILHWNIIIPGAGYWVEHNFAKDGRIRRRLRSGSGIYRLVGLDGAGKPANLDRAGGRDKTGTLYIGCFSDRSRILGLDRSLRPSHRPYRGYSDDHPAPPRLGAHSVLSKRFPLSRLALNWFHTEQFALAERIMLDAYEASFGEDPPLNRR
jgi:hypothetical protein